MADTDLDLPGEIWKRDILSGADHVMVSSYGRVRTADNTLITYHSWGKVARTRTYRGRLISPYIVHGAYYAVTLRIAKKTRHFAVHRMVCAAFHGAPPEGSPLACHYNGDGLDNRPENLRWGSPEENMADKLIHGTHSRGSRHGRTKLTDDNVRDIRRQLLAGRLGKDIAVDFEVTPSVVSDINTGRKWGYLV